MQSVSNTRTSDSFTAHERDLEIKHNPLGLRIGLCLEEPKRDNHCKEMSSIQSLLFKFNTLSSWQSNTNSV